MLLNAYNSSPWSGFYFQLLYSISPLIKQYFEPIDTQLAYDSTLHFQKVRKSFTCDSSSDDDSVAPTSLSLPVYPWKFTRIPLNTVAGIINPPPRLRQLHILLISLTRSISIAAKQHSSDTHMLSHMLNLSSSSSHRKSISSSRVSLLMASDLMKRRENLKLEKKTTTRDLMIIRWGDRNHLTDLLQISSLYSSMYQIGGSGSGLVRRKAVTTVIPKGSGVSRSRKRRLRW